MTDARRLAKDAPSMKLHELIDWDNIAHKLKGLYKREASNGGGPQPCEPLSMFKLMLLGQWPVRPATGAGAQDAHRFHGLHGLRAHGR
jgi:hypothetical protein